jgi:hypothetical protein
VARRVGRRHDPADRSKRAASAQIRRKAEEAGGSGRGAAFSRPARGVRRASVVPERDLPALASSSAGAGITLLKKEARDWRASFLIEYLTDTVYPRIRDMGYVAARTSRHKYINYRELQGMDELYDLENDPYEETNIIDRSAARETLRLMRPNYSG